MLYNIHTHFRTNQKNILEIVSYHPEAFKVDRLAYTIGIHPLYLISEKLEEHLAIVDRQLGDINCYGLGECGLDTRASSTLDLQIKVFEKQVLLAEKHNKPLIIHCVRAFQQLIAIRKKHSISVPIIVHGFSKNIILAKQLTDQGIYLSFGKHLLYNIRIKNILQSVSREMILFETDAAELPIIEEIYTLVAKYLGIDILTLEANISKNFKTIFKHDGLDRKNSIII